MLDEIKWLSGGLCHGNKRSTVENKTKEKRIDISAYNFERWVDCYSVSNFSSMKTLLNKRHCYSEKHVCYVPKQLDLLGVLNNEV